MTWSEIRNRLKSPVVMMQIILLIINAVVVLHPASADTAKIVVTLINGLYNIFAGVNNPTDPGNF